jgi:colicin import membrane protein
MSATAAATSARDAFRPRQPRGLGMGFALAVLAHVLLVLALAFSVNWHSSQVLGVEAELWSAVPQIAAPRAAAPEPPPPAPEPRPRAPEPPPKPVAKPEPALPDPQIAIEKAKKEQALREQARQEDLQRQKQQREQQQREQAQREAQERQQQEAQARQQREQERKKQQQDAAAQEAARQAYLKRMAGQIEGTGAPDSPGKAARSSGPSSDYAGRVAAYLKQKIFFDNSQVNGNPVAQVEIRTAPDGRILSRRLVQSSGVPAYDDAVLRAIDNAGVVPRDPNGVPPVMQLNFRPKD